MRKKSTGKSKGKSSGNNTQEDLLIDFSTPAPISDMPSTSVAMSGSQTVLDPFSPVKKSKSPKGQAVAVRTQDQQEATARGKEAEERRQSQKQAILDQRAARRKSMVNRRVSFAPEATLHTWNVIELVEDSTTSSASNSTRRQSSMTTAQTPQSDAQAPGLASDPAERPSTPPDQTEEPQVRASPAHPRDLHQRKQRRSSTGISPSAASTEEVFSSSPCSGSSTIADESPVRVEESSHSDDEDTDAEGDTAMSMDEVTAQTVASTESGSSTSSLDERLKRAAKIAGTRGIDYDENGDDLSMELATGTVTNAFQPWAQKAVRPLVQDLSALQDQENINPFSPAFKAQLTANQVAEVSEDTTQGMSMDVTATVGGILKKSSPGNGRRTSIAPARRRSSVARRPSLGGSSAADEETMDFTLVGGGIVRQQGTERLVAQIGDQAQHNDSTAMSDEEMTMEFTNVVGGVVDQRASKSVESYQTTTMDRGKGMAAAGDCILTPIEERTEPQTDIEEDQNVGMDITKAIGTILPPHFSTLNKSRAKVLMKNETDAGQLSNTPPRRATSSGLHPESPSVMSTHAATSVVSETGSPSIALKPRLSGRNRNITSQHSTTPQSPEEHPTSLKWNFTPAHSTPTKQLTPQPSHAHTPNKTPTIPNVTHRGASPKKLFKAEIKAKASPAANKERKGLFDLDEETGQQTPSVVLNAPKPHQHLRRRSSGLGIDREGLGSPRVAELLDRRASIGEAATTFVPSDQKSRVLRFDDAKSMEMQVDAERAEEERRESGRFVMEQEADLPPPSQNADEENTTMQLKEMIESMTPKKEKPGKLRGRKSLHVGAARGILGKRPAELDIDSDEDEGEGTPKRLKAVSKESSPVKKVYLPRPPTKDETTGRVTRANRKHLEEATATITITPSLSQSPGKSSAVNTPQPKGRFKDAPTTAITDRPTSFEEKLDNVIGAVDVSITRAQEEEPRAQEQEKIPLQTFLNMTNIHFIELSTTKRRHTTATAVPLRPSQETQTNALESCFAAAATTLPLLELYQHATRELKSYISSGRRIIRSIEDETLEAQPPLFQEYVDARPDVRMVMDNQFRNGKTNARLQSKEGWYTWRGQLVDGLRGGLEGILKGMQDDAENLSGQERVLERTVPLLLQRHAELEAREKALRQRAVEMESIDHDAITEARALLSSVDSDVKQKKVLLERLRHEMRDKIDTLATAGELKTELQSQIEEADRVREQCRGWSANDVRALKEKVDATEKQTGWALITAEEETEEPNGYGVALTMRYKECLRLFFYPDAFRMQGAQQIEHGKEERKSRGRKSKSDCRPTAPISLTYSPIGGDGSASSDQLSTEKRFFLQLLRSQLHALAAMPKGTVRARTLLNTVASGWDVACRVTEEVRLLNMLGITSVSIRGDERLGVHVMLLVFGKGRIDVDIEALASVNVLDGVVETRSDISAEAVYGQTVGMFAGGKAVKVQQALRREVERRGVGEGVWMSAVGGLREWVAAQQVHDLQIQSQQQQKPNHKQESEQGQPQVQQPQKRSPLKERTANVVPKKLAPITTTATTATQKLQDEKISVENLPASKLPVLQQTTVPSQPVVQGKDSNGVEGENGAYEPRTPFKRTAALRRTP